MCEHAPAETSDYDDWSSVGTRATLQQTTQPRQHERKERTGGGTRVASPHAHVYPHLGNRALQGKPLFHIPRPSPEPAEAQAASKSCIKAANIGVCNTKACPFIHTTTLGNRGVQPKAPPGLCFKYWNTGTCASAVCPFLHRRDGLGPQAASSSQQQQQPPRSARPAIAPTHPPPGSRRVAPFQHTQPSYPRASGARRAPPGPPRSGQHWQ
eukprot:g70300.t1